VIGFGSAIVDLLQCGPGLDQLISNWGPVAESHRSVRDDIGSVLASQTKELRHCGRQMHAVRQHPAPVQPA